MQSQNLKKNQLFVVEEVDVEDVEGGVEEDVVVEENDVSLIMWYIC